MLAHLKKLDFFEGSLFLRKYFPNLYTPPVPRLYSPCSGWTLQKIEEYQNLCATQQSYASLNNLARMWMWLIIFTFFSPSWFFKFSSNSSYLNLSWKLYTFPWSWSLTHSLIATLEFGHKEWLLVPGDKIKNQNFWVWGVYRPLRPKSAIPHPITIENMRFER